MKNFFKNLFGATKPKPQIQKRPYVFGRGFSTDPLKDMTGYKLHPDLLYSLYKYQSDITNCVDRLSVDSFSAGYEFVNPIDENQKISNEILTDLKEIFGFGQGWEETKQQIVRDYKVCGNAYVAIVKGITGDRILGFQALDPRTISIVSDRFGNIYKYIQQVSASTVTIFDPEEVLHFKNNKDIKNEVFGFAPVEPIFWEAKTDIAAMISNCKFFENDAKPASLFILDDAFYDLDEQQKAELMDKIKDQFGGAENRGKSAIMSMIKDVKLLNITHKDMEFLTGRAFTRKKICGRFGVPEFLLGYTEAVNNNNGELLREQYWGDVVSADEKYISSVFNYHFFGKIDGLVGKIIIRPKPQSFERLIKSITDRSLKELDRGVITRLQYKKRLGHEITEADKRDPMYDQHIIYSGASAVLPEDIGVDPVIDPNDKAAAKNYLEIIESFKNE